MGKGDPCEICGGTESNLVDGFYYCTECGTQDTNVRETLVERNLLADGTLAIAKRQKISRKLKEGIKMSAEWYKWHTFNFILAGLTEQLVQLGAAPSLKMKVLWIWTRYIKKFQKKDQMKQTQMFSKLEASSESEDSSAAAAAAAGEQEYAIAPLHRVTRFLLAVVLALALNLDRSALQPSHLVRLVLHRLLDLNGFQRFVPADIDPADVPGFRWLCSTPLSRCGLLPYTMARLARRLDLGPPLAPDAEALLADRLRELRLPPDLGRLALALMDRAPIPFADARRRGPRVERHPDYEAVVTAYALVALKMCFGLDDDRERRLSDAVDRLNAEGGHPRAYSDAPGATARLFSPREWLEHLRFRAAALCAHYAPLAWERNMRADGRAFVEHFEDHAYAGRGGRGGRRARGGADARAVGDRLAMDVLRGMPGGGAPDVVPLAALKPCMAARAPHAALADAVAAHARDERTRRLLREDFTRYSAEYAYRTLALPDADPGLFEGVAETGKTVSAGPDRDYCAPRSDPTVVHVRNCENKNWFRTRRPTASHVVGPEEPDAKPELAADPDAKPELAAEPDADDLEERRDEDPETFREEAEGENIFDDDFWDVGVKEEIKIEGDPESSRETRDGPESRSDRFGNSDGLDENVGREGSDGEGPAFDSDEERPRYDPAAFDRRQTVRNIMVAAYRELKMYSLPVRFAPDRDGPETSARRTREPAARAAPGAGERPRVTARAAMLRDRRERVQHLVAAYRDHLRRDVLHQVAGHVRAFVDDAERRMEDDVASDRGDAAADDASSTDTLDARAAGDDTDDEDPARARDPVYRGAAGFDAREHDARQLYVRLARAPPPPAAREPPDTGDDEVARLLDEKIAAPVPPRGARAPRTRDPIDFARIDHLVDDPESVTRFNYWVTHYTFNFRKGAQDSEAAQRSFDETLPRSFRLVLRECAAQLHVMPMLLYRYVMDVEDAVLAAVSDGRERRRAPPSRRKRAARAATRSKVPKENAAARAEARDGPAGKRKRKKRVARKPKLDDENLDDEDLDDDVSSAIVFS